MGDVPAGYRPFRSKSEFDEFVRRHPDVLERRRAWSRELFELADDRQAIEGWCDGCSAPMPLDAGRPSNAADFREALVCGRCGLNARARMVAQLTSTFVARASTAEPIPYATEQTSHYFRWLKQRIPDAIGSEYFGSADRPRLQDYLDGLLGSAETLRFEDVTRLSLGDRSVDLVISSDVLEHVPDHGKALREFRRVLRPGGWLVVTVPFSWDRQASRVRARIDAAGRIEHLLEPEYHGDPMNEQGVLAFHSFGWDLLADLRAAGFVDACWALAWRPAALLLADLWVLVARTDRGMEFDPD